MHGHLTGGCLAAVVATVALAVAAPARPTTIPLDERLTAVARVTVTCAPGELRVGGSGVHSEDGVSGNYAPGLITLSSSVCARLEATLAGDYRQLGWAAASWHTLAHEVAHHLGYDHGETTIGADCHGERLERRLMKRAGIPRVWRVAIQRYVVYACPPGFAVIFHPPSVTA